MRASRGLLADFAFTVPMVAGLFLTKYPAAYREHLAQPKRSL